MPRKQGGFRVQRKAFGLTYSCPRTTSECIALFQSATDDQKKEGVHAPECKCENPIKSHSQLEGFYRSLGQCEYRIGKELHKSGLVHWHTTVIFKDLFESHNPLCFDPTGLDKKIHANILDGAPKLGWRQYCAKEKEVVESVNFPPDQPENPLAVALKKRNHKEALEHLWETRTNMPTHAVPQLTAAIEELITPAALAAVKVATAAARDSVQDRLDTERGRNADRLLDAMQSLVEVLENL